MQLFSLLIIFLATVALGVPANPPIPGYNIVEIQWEVQPYPDGPLILVNGTVQDVYREMTKLNPNYAIDYPIPDSVPSSDIRHDVDYDVEGYFCFGRWPPCSWTYIADGIVYLRHVRGRAHLGPGPGACGRVSCSYDSAIYLCNDNSYGKDLDNWGNVADAAQFLCDHCSDPPFNLAVAGQVFYRDKWNVIVRGGDRC